MTTDQIKFYGGADAVTGSNFMLQTAAGHQMLIDCGLTQGSDELERRNWQPFAYDPSAVGDLIVTHAHMDHIGLIGKLIAEGFKGQIYSTQATKDLAQVMLADGLQIMRHDAKRMEVEPLWDDSHLQSAFSKWKTFEYHSPFKLSDQLTTVEYFDAGHILGSAMAKITTPDNVVTFTGDLGNSPSVLLRNTESITDSEYLIMEAVYGNRNHDDTAVRQQKLNEILQRAIDRGGAIIIPAFSLERTQMLLYELNELVESGQLPSIPVFLDSPLAIKVLEIYRRSSKYFKDSVQSDINSGDNIFDFPGLEITKTKQESQAIKGVGGPKIIIAGSGMSHAGRVLFHELEYLDQTDTTILFIGYQAPGTVGRQMLEGNKQVRIKGRRIKVRAAVESLLSYSSHKDQQNLYEFAKTAADYGTKFIAVVLSEPKTALEFSNLLINSDEIKAQVLTPELKQVLEL
jgi:metallo-beta-lactamase family protein